MFDRCYNNHKFLVYISQLLLAEYMKNMYTITFKSNHKFQQLYRPREKQNYLESCRDVVEMDLDIKQLEQRKCKIEDDLAEVNGQLSSMKKCYADMEKKNSHLRNAFVQKLKVLSTKNCEG